MLPLEKQNLLRSRYRQAHPDWRPATEVYEQTIRCYLTPGMRVLDIGCGRGGAFEQLGEAVSFPVGLDSELESLQTHRLPWLSRAAGLVTALPFAAATFDLVICSWVLEHVADPVRTFAEVRRVLKAGGRFIFLTPNAASPLTILARLLRPLQRVLVTRLYARYESDTFPVVYRANTRQAIVRAMHNVGLQLEALYYIQDPTYLAFTGILYHIAAWWSTRAPMQTRVHLLGIGQHPEGESQT